MRGFNQGALPGEDYQEFGRSLEESPHAARILQREVCVSGTVAFEIRYLARNADAGQIGVVHQQGFYVVIDVGNTERTPGARRAGSGITAVPETEAVHSRLTLPRMPLMNAEASG